MLVVGGRLVGAVFAHQHRRDVLLLHIAEGLIPDRRQIGRVVRCPIIGIAGDFIGIGVCGIDQLIGHVECHRIGGNPGEVRGVAGAFHDDQRTRINRLHRIAGLGGSELPIGARVRTAPGRRAMRLVGQIEADDGGVARKGLRQIFPGLGELGGTVIAVIPQTARIGASPGGGVVIVQDHLQTQLPGLCHDGLEHAQRVQTLQIGVEPVIDARRHRVGDHRLQAERDADGVEAEANHLLHRCLVAQHVQTLRRENAAFHAIPIDGVDLHRRAVGINNQAAIGGQIAARQQRAGTCSGEIHRRADINRDVGQLHRRVGHRRHRGGAGRGRHRRGGGSGGGAGECLIVEHKAGRNGLRIAAGQKANLRRIAGRDAAIVPDIADCVGAADMAVDCGTPDIGDGGIEREAQRPSTIDRIGRIRIDRQAALIPTAPIRDVSKGNGQCGVGNGEAGGCVAHVRQSCLARFGPDRIVKYRHSMRQQILNALINKGFLDIN